MKKSEWIAAIEFERQSMFQHFHKLTKELEEAQQKNEELEAKVLSLDKALSRCIQIIVQGGTITLNPGQI